MVLFIVLSTFLIREESSKYYQQMATLNTLILGSEQVLPFQAKSGPKGSLLTSSKLMEVVTAIMLLSPGMPLHMKGVSVHRCLRS